MSFGNQVGKAIVKNNGIAFQQQKPINSEKKK
jgi:hypothetical protein